MQQVTTTLQPFYGPFSEAGAKRELLDFMVQGEINRLHAAGHKRKLLHRQLAPKQRRHVAISPTALTLKKRGSELSSSSD